MSVSNDGATIEQAQFRDIAAPRVTASEEIKALEQSADVQVQLALEENSVFAARAISSDSELVLRGILSMRQATRSVTGAVQYPGLYPIAGKVSPSDLIDAAGGMLDGADETQVLITSLANQSGRLIKRASTRI